MNPKESIQTLLEHADIQIDGSRPWDIQVHNDELYKKVIQKGTLGAGEAYMDGWWDCQALDEMFYRAIRAHLEKGVSNNLPAYALKIYQTLFNLQDKRHAAEVAETHYNFSNSMFEYMLGPTMVYSCGYWRDATSLDAAQEAKMDLVARKLYLQPGMTVLDIGCGWGSLAHWLVEHYKVRVTGISISSEQIDWAKEHFTSDDITWIIDDYRSLEGKFDRIVSVGMFEHVGYKNYDEFMRTARKLLKPDGLFLLHTIGSNYQKHGADPWINKYIFPNGMVPSEESVTRAFSEIFIMEDWQNFGAYYDPTLMAWHARFQKGCEEGKIQLPERVRRMFAYYLLSCAGAFRARDLQVWEIVLSPHGVPGGYKNIC